MSLHSLSLFTFLSFLSSFSHLRLRTFLLCDNQSCVHLSNTTNFCTYLAKIRTTDLWVTNTAPQPTEPNRQLQDFRLKSLLCLWKEKSEIILTLWVLLIYLNYPPGSEMMKITQLLRNLTKFTYIERKFYIDNPRDVIRIVAQYFEFL